ncbi:MAG: patatin-like phospholipase family protein [Promethearchaeota archaeon]
MSKIGKIGLVCEGGGQRIVHTAGILDYFLEKNLHFPYVIGVSAGASNSLSYVSRQIGRNKEVDIEYARDHRYSSLLTYVKTGSLFGMKFLFDDIPNKLVPFDYDVYFNSPTEHVIGATNSETGKTEYFYKSNLKKSDLMDTTIASCSLPFMGKIKFLNGKQYLDGGISDPIPIKKAIEDGFKKNVVILTQNAGYRKEPFKNFKLLKRIFRGYDGIEEVMMERHDIYNKTLDFLRDLEADCRVFIFRPQEPLQVGRTTKNKEKLENLYKQGYLLAKEKYKELIEWIG